MSRELWGATLTYASGYRLTGPRSGARATAALVMATSLVAETAEHPLCRRDARRGRDATAHDHARPRPARRPDRHRLDAARGVGVNRVTERRRRAAPG